MQWPAGLSLFSGAAGGRTWRAVHARRVGRIRSSDAVGRVTIVSVLALYALLGRSLRLDDMSHSARYCADRGNVAKRALEKRVEHTKMRLQPLRRSACGVR